MWVLSQIDQKIFEIFIYNHKISWNWLQMVKISLVFLAEISSWLQHTEFFFVQNDPWVLLEAEIFSVFWALSFFETGKKSLLTWVPWELIWKNVEQLFIGSFL